MYEHDPDADLVKNADLFHQCSGVGRIRKNVAADFENKNFAFEQADVRRRVFQRRYNDCPVLACGH